VVWIEMGWARVRGGEGWVLQEGHAMMKAHIVSITPQYQ
jgi:hypothetical protein